MPMSRHGSRRFSACAKRCASSITAGRRLPSAFRSRPSILDLAIIVFFIATPLLQDGTAFLWFDYTVAAFVAADMAARLLASNDMLRQLKQPRPGSTCFILLTLLFPQALANFAFLRILQAVDAVAQRRPVAAFRVCVRCKPVARDQPGGYQPADVPVRLTGFIYTFFFRDRPGIEGYVDALYFTVTTVTTTGLATSRCPE